QAEAMVDRRDARVARVVAPPVVAGAEMPGGKPGRLRLGWRGRPARNGRGRRDRGRGRGRHRPHARLGRRRGGVAEPGGDVATRGRGRGGGGGWYWCWFIARRASEYRGTGTGTRAPTPGPGPPAGR